MIKLKPSHSLHTTSFNFFFYLLNKIEATITDMPLFKNTFFSFKSFRNIEP